MNTAPTLLTAWKFIDRLVALQATSGSDNARFFRDENPQNKILNMRMAGIFALAKQFTQMSLSEIEKLLDNNYYEVRMGAVGIMDFKARNKKITEENRKELYDLYLNKHDRINNWDLVDRSAPFVVGGYLFDKPRLPLYKLAKSKNVWERRTAIVSTYYFIRKNDLDDTFRIAALLINDNHDLIQKAVGSWIREAGKYNSQMLIDFLDNHAATMPRTTLRYAIEKLDSKRKAYYLQQGKG